MPCTCVYLMGHYVNYPMMLVNLLFIHGTEWRVIIESAWRLTAPKRLVSDHDRRR